MYNRRGFRSAAFYFPFRPPLSLSLSLPLETSLFSPPPTPPKISSFLCLSPFSLAAEKKRKGCYFESIVGKNVSSELSSFLFRISLQFVVYDFVPPSPPPNLDRDLSLSTWSLGLSFASRAPGKFPPVCPPTLENNVVPVLYCIALCSRVVAGQFVPFSFRANLC